ncbi:MAG TPA: transcriptional regulator, partial [Cyanobacteria bacterium UBA8543]|nr:transcriptional regulator [Cyanobacteria bacterium UBA8543]
MNIDMFTQQVQTFQDHLTKLYQRTNNLEHSGTDSLLPSVFKELGTSSEELQVAAEELLVQTDEVVALKEQLEAERLRYLELFEFMPDAYLVSDPQGKILEANRAADTLLGFEKSSLQGKFLVSFIPVEKRPAFRSTLTQLNQDNWVTNRVVSMQSRQGQRFDVAMTVAPVRENSGKLVSLRWILRDITATQRAKLSLSSPEYNPSQDRPKQCYFKGDIIPLEPEQLWIVSQGLVKLTTMDEYGQEVLVGLVGSSMPFGSSLTDLPTYQAIALTRKVELVSVSLAEIAVSPKLAQALLPQISERLRQTEFFLAISGRRKVKERLNHLLNFLEQKFGEKVIHGTRVNIRLTHQDLADACCTTRVTITRLLGKLQQENKIMFDTHN